MHPECILNANLAVQGLDCKHAQGFTLKAIRCNEASDVDELFGTCLLGDFSSLNSVESTVGSCWRFSDCPSSVS